MINIKDFGFNEYTEKVAFELLEVLNKTENDYTELKYKFDSDENNRQAYFSFKNEDVSCDIFHIDFKAKKIVLKRTNSFRTVKATYNFKYENEEYLFEYTAFDKNLVTGFLGGLKMEYEMAKTLKEKFPEAFEGSDPKYTAVNRYFKAVLEKDLLFEKDLENFLKKFDSNYDRKEGESFDNFLSRKLEKEESITLIKPQ